MNFAEPETELAAPCRTCACREVFRDLAPPGQRERPVFLRCCQCKQERTDLEFYEQTAA
jgi:hypothetical protein